MLRVAVRYYPPSGDLYFDILTRLGEGAARTVRSEGRRIVRVQRFRSVEEMNAARAVASPEEAFERFLRYCARYWTISPRTYPRGVFKFRSLEEAQAARQPTPRV